MARDARVGELLEVLIVAQHEAPVHDVRQGREDVAAQVRALRGWRERPPVEGDGADHDEQRRREATHAPSVELTDADPPELTLLGEQQARDEERREDEEDVHEDPRAGQERQYTDVPQHEHDHAVAADAVEPGAVGEQF